MENMKNILVMKFGGTSVSDAGAMKAVASILDTERANWKNIVLVISALSGVTNLLIDAAESAARGELQRVEANIGTIRMKHHATINNGISDPILKKETVQKVDRFLSELSSLTNAMYVLGETTPRALDAVASLGEKMSVRVLSAILNDAKVPAIYIESTKLIQTNNNFQNAHPDIAITTLKTREVLRDCFNKGLVPIVTGFIGATEDGVITTLGRGGSDYSAALIGSVLPADEVWIWTDVDGVMTADPRIVKDARTISEISYAEVAELAYYGAKVLHPKTVRPVIEAGIGLRICNTFNPSNPGTRLIDRSSGKFVEDKNKVIKAVTTIRNQNLITIEGRGMLGVPGVAARTFAAVAATGTSVPLITQSSSEQSICFAIPNETTNQVLTSLEKEFSREIIDQDIDGVFASDPVSIVTIVGLGTRDTPGIAGKIFSKLGDENINVLAIAHGSSNVSISVVIDSADDSRAVIVLHSLIQ